MKYPTTATERIVPEPTIVWLFLDSSLFWSAVAIRNTILLALPLQTDLGREMFRGAQQVIARHQPRWHWKLMDAMPELLAKALRAPQLDLIHAGTIAFAFLPELEELILASGRPAVNVSGRLEQPRLPTVVSNNHRVGELAAQHLLHCGLSQFAFAGLGQGQFTTQRLGGFRAILAAAGRDCRHVLLKTRELRRWLARLPRPCGLFVAGDQLAARVVELAGELGRRVPEEFAVLGCDNETLWCATAPVPLSSVDLNGHRIGEVAAETLLGLLAGQPAPAGPIHIPPAGVVARASTELAFAADERLARALAVIRDRACEPLTVEALSGAVHVTQRTLERLFRRELGRNIHAEILRVRLRRACQLLRETDESVAGVATAAGFQDYGRFTRIFRQHTGATPTGYRQQFRHGV